MKLAKLSLHERIRRQLEARIMSGALQPGARIPVEQQLMQEFGCSRMTVSKALSALAAAGLIERRKRAGSFVSRPRVHSMLLHIPDLEAETKASGGRYEFRLLKRQVLPPARQSKLEMELADGGPLLAVTGVHVVNGQPLALEQRQVSLKAVPAVADVDFTVTSPGTWLLQHIPWTEAETRLSAAAADRRVAALLGVPAGSACLVVERRTWRRAKGITSVRQTFEGRSYDMVARFRPSDSRAR